MSGWDESGVPSFVSRASSTLLKQAWIVRWQIGCTATVTRPPRLLG